MFTRVVITRCCNDDINFHLLTEIFLITGKMFKSAELIYPIAFFQMFYNDKPVDWLLEHLIYTKVCNWEKDMVSTECEISHLILYLIQTLNNNNFLQIKLLCRSTASLRRQNFGSTINLRSFNTLA